MIQAQVPQADLHTQLDTTGNDPIASPADTSPRASASPSSRSPSASAPRDRPWLAAASQLLPAHHVSEPPALRRLDAMGKRRPPLGQPAAAAQPPPATSLAKQVALLQKEGLPIGGGRMWAGGCATAPPPPPGGGGQATQAPPLLGMRHASPVASRASGPSTPSCRGCKVLRGRWARLRGPGGAILGRWVGSACHLYGDLAGCAARPAKCWARGPQALLVRRGPRVGFAESEPRRPGRGR